jgi:hypothetical protein
LVGLTEKGKETDILELAIKRRNQSTIFCAPGTSGCQKIKRNESNGMMLRRKTPLPLLAHCARCERAPLSWSPRVLPPQIALLWLRMLVAKECRFVRETLARTQMLGSASLVDLPFSFKMAAAFSA